MEIIYSLIEDIKLKNKIDYELEKKLALAIVKNHNTVMSDNKILNEILINSCFSHNFKNFMLNNIKPRVINELIRLPLEKDDNSTLKFQNEIKELNEILSRPIDENITNNSITKILSLGNSVFGFISQIKKTKSIPTTGDLKRRSDIIKDIYNEIGDISNPASLVTPPILLKQALNYLIKENNNKLLLQNVLKHQQEPELKGSK